MTLHRQTSVVSLADEVRARLGYRRLNRGWAKAEILLGLTSVGAGLFVGLPAASRSVDESYFLLVAGLLLFVLGGYLTLAGHRSHLYQSSNERLVLLIEEIRGQHQKDSIP